MHTIIHPSPQARRTPTAGSHRVAAFRTPLYDCADQGESLKVVVFLPGVDASGVTIEARGPDLLVTAEKARVVRVNWRALHLEKAQRDYRLRLRFGRGFDFGGMNAEMANGVLTVTLPKRAAAAGASRLRRVA